MLKTCGPPSLMFMEKRKPQSKRRRGQPDFMYCVDCSNLLEVIDSRRTREGIRRRRRCIQECGDRVTTIEITRAEYDRLLAGPIEFQETKQKLREVLAFIDPELLK